MNDRLTEQLEKKGLRARVVRIERLADLKEAIEGPRREGVFEDGFFQVELSLFKNTMAAPRWARSIIVASVPQPIIGVTFEWEGKKLQTTIPPTYVDVDAIDRRVIGALEAALGRDRCRFEPAIKPRKKLAVRSGLADYGRNNITYVPHYGSFHRLVAFFSDLECAVDAWREPILLPACKTCRACLKACPGGAITEDRFIIHGERCLTYLNERVNEPFPSWLDAKAHHAIIGCLRCQQACPYNKETLNWIEQRASFSEEETRYLLRGEFAGSEAKAMEERLATVGLDLAIFPRNLAVLVSLAP
jgi:epoxyqueuosine reductase